MIQLRRCRCSDAPSCLMRNAEVRNNEREFRGLTPKSLFGGPAPQNQHQRTYRTYLRSTSSRPGTSFYHCWMRKSRSRRSSRRTAMATMMGRIVATTEGADDGGDSRRGRNEDSTRGADKRRGALTTAMTTTTDSAAAMATGPVTQQSTGRSNNGTTREGRRWRWGGRGRGHGRPIQEVRVSVGWLWN